MFATRMETKQSVTGRRDLVHVTGQTLNQAETEIPRRIKVRVKTQASSAKGAKYDSLGHRPRDAALRVPLR